MGKLYNIHFKNTTPIYLRPYTDFSPHTPNFSATL